MRIDPKYFNIFLVIVAVIAALVIAYFTISSQQNKLSDFKERMMQQDSLQTISWLQVSSSDGLRIADFREKFVLLCFWSNWSEASVGDHKKIARLKQDFGDQLTVIAAAVGLQKEEALAYIANRDFPFYYVAGSRQFSAFGVPGVPTYMLYSPDGTLEYISQGMLDDTKFDSLEAVINNGKQ